MLPSWICTLTLIVLCWGRPFHRCGCGTIPLEAGDWLGNSVVGLAGDLVDRAVESSRINSTGKLLQRTHISERIYRTNIKGAIECN